jgi:predicted AAA+ superfamily ATPase
MYYFRDTLGNEIDLITERDGEAMAIEIKSGIKTDSNMLRGLKYWQKLQPKTNCILLHRGSNNEIITDTMSIAPWTDVMNL